MCVNQRMFKNTGFKLHTLLIIVLGVFILGCTPFSKKMEIVLSDENYSEAKMMLQEENAWDKFSEEAKADSEISAARTAFQTKIEDDYSGRNKTFLFQAEIKQAKAVVQEGMKLCPWSPVLTKLHDANLRTISEIKQKALELEKILAGKWYVDNKYSDLKKVLLESKSIRLFVKDYPDKEKVFETTETHIIAFWETEFKKVSLLNPAQITTFKDDLILINAPETLINTIFDVLTVSYSISKDNEFKFLSAIENQRLIIHILDELKKPVPAIISHIFDFSAKQLDTLLIKNLRLNLNSVDVKFEIVNFAEKVISANPVLRMNLIQELALAHMNRAQLYVAAGKIASLSLFHLERVSELNLAKEPVQFSSIKKTAKATISSAGKSIFYININTNPSDDPTIQDIVKKVLLTQLNLRSKKWISWKLSSNQKNNPVSVNFSTSKLFQPSINDLRWKQSKYFSHYDTVPNPRKKYYSRLIDSQKFTLDMAERNYDSAVSSHNIYPTEYSLSNANYAKSSYIMALNTYNRYVNAYNSTPSTIQQKVYLPYSFQEGYLTQGWELQGDISHNKATDDFYLRNVETDFVRIGTKTYDVNPSYRRNDGIDIKVGAERQIEQLYDDIDQIINKIDRILDKYEHRSRTTLVNDEKLIIAALNHPIRKTGNSTRFDLIPGWAVNSLKNVFIPEPYKVPIPEITVIRDTHKNIPKTAEEYYQKYADLIPIIYSHGQIESVGSGALVSEDGLILTCAHVLDGESFEVQFFGKKNERHRADIVFANEKEDVAILRIRSFKSDRWINIDVDNGIGAGESIIAIGNPSLKNNQIASNSISEGIISKPYNPNDEFYSQSIVADITVASGSSGGPIFSKKTGNIIGVVMAVIAPTIDKNFATSGYRALIKPSTMLGEWLGVRYNNNRNKK